jgi:hypothetical protein
VAPASSAAPGSVVDPTAALGYTFRQLGETTDTATVSIVYPVLIDLGAGSEAAVNRALDDWAQQLAAEFIAAETTSEATTKSVLEIELAPEVRSRAVFSLSGLQFEFDASADSSITRRIGWIFSIEDGSVVQAIDLFATRTLEPLAAAAAAHLVADVLGDPELLTTPDGVAATAENFDAVWLTPEGIAVGFDQYQVAGADAGSPAVLIPYAELGEVLERGGILGALVDDRLPTGL